MDRRFEIEGEITRQYRRFNAVGTQLTVRLQPPPSEENPVSHFFGQCARFVSTRITRRER